MKTQRGRRRELINGDTEGSETRADKWRRRGVEDES